MKVFLKDLLRDLGAFSTGRLLPAVLLFLLGAVLIRLILRLVNAVRNAGSDPAKFSCTNSSL